MSSRDYLTRYFQQLGKVLAALMGLRERKEYQLAIDNINQLLDTWFNLPEEQIDTMLDEEFNELIFQDRSSDFEKERSIAELLYQKAITYREMHETEKAMKIASKAFIILKTIDVESGIFSFEIQQKIAELDKILLKATPN